MAQNDIYNSKAKYQTFMANRDKLLVPPSKAEYKRKYYCKNKANLRHFKTLHNAFETRDTSYVRRLRLFNTLIFVLHQTPKELSTLDRDDVNRVVAKANHVFQSERTRVDFRKDLKFMWKTLFPELDEEGRPDDTQVPYPVRHLRTKAERSKEKGRADRLTLDEFEKLVVYFSKDTRMQAYLTLALESLARPQELLYLKLKDIQFFDDFAKIYVSEHSKEGVKLIQCIDSFPYVQKWLKTHPNRKEKTAYLFSNLSGNKQLTPFNINKMLRTACKNLAIEKPITCYSLKRNGVTFRRMKGESDVEIQHAAGWTSTKQLSTYDLSTQEDVFLKRLFEKGKIGTDHPKYAEIIQASAFTERECHFCGTKSPFTEEFCANDACGRMLDREKLKQQIENDGMISVKQVVKELVADRTLLAMLKDKLNEMA